MKRFTKLRITLVRKLRRLKMIPDEKSKRFERSNISIIIVTQSTHRKTG